MRKIAFISALLLSAAPVQAQSVGGADAVQIKAMGSMMLAGALEGYCPTWSVNVQAVNALMVRSRLKTSDLNPGGRFSFVMGSVSKWVEERIASLVVKDYCLAAEASFGAEGSVEPNLMRKR